MKLRKPEDKRYQIDYDRTVFVYKNLHQDCWSVKQDGLVKAHTKELILWDCLFQVNSKGRERVLEERQKNVHAGIIGRIDDLEFEMNMPDVREVTYNPYKHKTFVDKFTKKPILQSEQVKLEPKNVYAIVPCFGSEYEETYV